MLESSRADREVWTDAPSEAAQSAALWPSTLPGAEAPMAAIKDHNDKFHAGGGCSYVALDSQCSRHGAGPGWRDLLLPSTRRKLKPGDAPPYLCANDAICHADEVGVVPLVVPLTVPDFDGEVSTVAFFEVHIVPSWSPQQLLLSLGQLRAPLTPETNGGWLEDDARGRGSALVLNTRWTTGELRQVRCAVEWRGADDHQTSWLMG